MNDGNTAIKLLVVVETKKVNKLSGSKQTKIMESKDNRSKSKRSKMKQHNYKKATRNTTTVGGNTLSSAREQAVRGIIDVADSSDDRFTDGRGWIRSKISGVAPQPAQRCSLEDTLDDIDNLDNEQLRAPDFEQIAQMPTSVGGHFRFSSEKNWDLTDNQELLDGTEASEYFTLNLKLLNVGLQSIPFYKRMDYSVNMFSSNQIKNIGKDAEAAETRYQQILQEHNENVDSTKNIKSSKKTTAIDAVNGTITQLANVNLNGDIAKEKLSFASQAPPEAQDIQQWLDNVLEE